MSSEGSLKYVRKFGSNYLKDSLFTVEEKKRTYGKKMIPIGTKRNGQVYYLDLSHACRILLIGMTRSGKTFSLRSMADRFRKSGYALLFLPDVKDEFRSSIRPVQQQFHHLLLKGEEPQGMPVITYRPTFFKTIGNKLPKDNIWYSPHFSNISKVDFMTLFRAESLTNNQQNMLEIIYEALQQQDADKFKLEDMDMIIDGLTEMATSSKVQMKFKFRPFKTSKFYEEEHIKSIVKTLQDGNAVAINMEGFDNYGKGGFAYPEVVFSIVLRAAINARRKKLIPPLWVIVDEASRFVPNDQNPSCKRVVTESVDVDSRYEINYAFAVQDITKLPEEVVKQCRYIMVPYSADVPTIKACMSLGGLIRYQQTAINDALKVKHSLKKFEWMIIDRTAGGYEIIKFLSPLSEHMLQGD